MGASTKQKEPSKRVAKSSTAKSARETQPAVQIAKQPPRVQAEPARPAVTTQELSVPDLSAFGVSAGDARAHVGVCESCGRAYRHVVKNPKDVTALGYFGRNIAACLATNALGRTPAAGHAAP